jgi:hypothetical protein
MNRTRVVTVGLITVAIVLSSGGGLGQASPPCAVDLDSCPDNGCAEPGTPDALVNQGKRRIPPAGTPVRLTLDDVERLQSQADQLVGQKVALDQPARDRLQDLDLKSSDELVSEGDLVEVVGYVIGLPHRPKASGPESVNCRLPGADNNDYNIPLARHPEDTEFEGIVVEMIPQDRLDAWTVGKLRRIAREGRPVVVRGQLFYDNLHEVNDDPDNVKGGQPKRFALWEVHPITEVYVCVTASKKCDLKKVKEPQWKRLEKVPD